MYLRFYCHEDPKQWLPLLPWAELWYNSEHHSSLGMTSFKALYGKEAFELKHYITGESDVEAVDMVLELRENTMTLLKENLQKAQSRMKLQADKKRADIIFDEGE